MRTKPRSLNNSVGEIDSTNPLDVTGGITLQDPNDSTREVEFDPLFKAPLSISIDHHEIHEGDSFTAWVNDTDFDKTDTINICFSTPAGAKLIHMVPLVDCSIPSLFEILSNPTVTADSGTELTAVNRHFGSANVSIVESIETSPVAGDISYNCTIAADGTVKHVEALGAGKKTLGSGGSRGTQEFILAPSTTYAFRVTGVNITDNGVGAIVLTWYEHTSG